MKKLILVTILIMSCGCIKVEDDTAIDEAWTYHQMSSYTKTIKIDGHTYIILNVDRGGNIIHAASCGCGK